MKDCLFCNQQLEEISRIPSKPAYACDCVGCGEYSVTDPFVASLKSTPLDSEAKARIAAVLYERIDKSQPIAINDETIKKLLSLYPKTVSEKLAKALLNLHKMSAYFGQQVNIAPTSLPILYALNTGELEEIISALKEQGYIRSTWDGIGSEYVIVITAKGYERIYELGKVNPASPQAFVAMWFPDSEKDKINHDALEKAYDNGFKKAIKEAGYDDRRIDRKEFLGKIDDEIIGEIKRSRFLVADFTGQRGGVYYEAGFAHGLGIPVIYTCREDHKEKCHFDTRQYKHIFWKDEADLYKQLYDRIRANIGQGPEVKQG